MRLRPLLISISAVLATASLAYASGNYSSLPIVGGASFCNAQSTFSGGQGCQQTIPAGPPSVTGMELVPADTNTGGEAPPQTVVMSMRSLNAAPITYNLCAAAACGTVVVGNNSGGVLFDYTGTITSATVTLPASPMDGQMIIVASPYTITSLTVGANTGQTLAVTTPTVLTASTTVPQGYKFMYVASNAKWYRIY